MKTLGGRLVSLTAAMLAMGVLLAAIGYAVAGVRAVEGVAYSVLLCLIPGLMTVFLGEFLKSRNLSAYVVLAGGGFRMFFVLLGMFAVSALRPDLGFREFTLWLLLSYLVSLAIETVVILVPVSGKNASDQGCQ